MILSENDEKKRENTTFFKKNSKKTGFSFDIRKKQGILCFHCNGIFVSDAVKVFAYVAQSVEHFLGKEEVSGSSPDIGSIFCQ